jgi:superfamily I DNA/RNA helicase
VWIIGDQDIRGFQDALGGAVILLQFHPANILIANNPHVFEKRLFSELGQGSELKVVTANSDSAPVSPLPARGNPLSAAPDFGVARRATSRSTDRGARPQNLVLLKEDFPALEVVKLEQNYRSSQRILNWEER